ncbi:PREDICTED: phytohormone-binding protein-like [Fragaria vesca subsp. vesca]|uniref:phytohormone-binding protein-like n=1 Tax=Fragaria vesca subsp. vesca TaxID=101020 RepID=UPI0002C30EEE|nr:PREDICTED: phytohormone-binding protein-like [Fragaria vesca subsp. vesca]
MARETKAQRTVGVGVEALWKGMTKDLVSVMPKIMPDIVQSVEVVEGDGGLGSVLLFKLGRDPLSKRQQTEKIVELDESQYRFALQVLEGPALTLRDFSSLTTTFQLSAISEKETLVDMKVEYATEKEAAANMGEIAMQPVLSFVQLLEKLVLES